MNTYKWLLKRVFWEHKGGFFWAPAVIGALLTIGTGLSVLSGLIMKSKHGLSINGEQVVPNVSGGYTLSAQATGLRSGNVNQVVPTSCG